MLTHGSYIFLALTHQYGIVAFDTQLNEVEGGNLVSPCPFVHSVSSTILAGSISYVHILSSNFIRCVTCQVCFEIQNWSFGKFFKFVTFTLSCFDFGSNMNWSIVWVIIGRRGYTQNTGVPFILVLDISNSKFIQFVLCRMSEQCSQPIGSEIQITHEYWLMDHNTPPPHHTAPNPTTATTTTTTTPHPPSGLYAWWHFILDHDI